MSAAAASSERMAYCHVCRGEVIPVGRCCPLCATELLDVRLRALPVLARRLDPGPFLAWAEVERARIIEVEGSNAPGGLHGNDQGWKRLAARLGMNYEQLLRMRRMRSLPEPKLATCLARMGVSIEDVYGPAPKPVPAWERTGGRQRARPRLRVTPVPKMVAKERPADVYKPTSPRPRATHRLRLSDEQIAYAREAYAACPVIMFAAREVERRYGLCGYPRFMSLYQAVQSVLKEGAGSRTYSPRSKMISEEVAYEAAWRYYLDQWGFVRIGRHLYRLHGREYATARGFAEAIYREFVRRGWPRRDRIEATRIASYKHGFGGRERYSKPREEGEGTYRQWLRHQRRKVRPQCQGTVRNGPRAGQRCMRNAVVGQEYCYGHMGLEGGDETLRAKQLKVAGTMRARADASKVPIEPFAVWLEDKCSEFRSASAMCEMMEQRGVGKKASLQSLYTQIVRRRWSVVGRETVERFLGVLGETASEADQRVREATVRQLASALQVPDEQVRGMLRSERVTFEDLYGPYVLGDTGSQRASSSAASARTTPVTQSRTVSQRPPASPKF